MLHDRMPAYSQTQSKKKHHSHLRVPLKIEVWIYDTFDNNLQDKNYFTKYFMESFLLQIFSKIWFGFWILPKLSGFF